MLVLEAFAFWICTRWPVFGGNSLKCDVFTLLSVDIEHVCCVLTAHLFGIRVGTDLHMYIYKALLSIAVSPQIYLKITSAQNILNPCF